LKILFGNLAGLADTISSSIAQEKKLRNARRAFGMDRSPCPAFRFRAFFRSAGARDVSSTGAFSRSSFQRATTALMSARVIAPASMSPNMGRSHPSMMDP
jgi:hypothetical protein